MGVEERTAGLGVLRPERGTLRVGGSVSGEGRAEQMVHERRREEKEGKNGCEMELGRRRGEVGG